MLKIKKGAIYRCLPAPSIRTTPIDEASSKTFPTLYPTGQADFNTPRLRTEIGLVNGSMGSICNILWDSRQDPSSMMPSIILIKFDECNGPDFPQCDPGVINVFLATRQFECKGVACSLPSSLYGSHIQSRIHKSQGLTLCRAVKT